MKKMAMMLVLVCFLILGVNSSGCAEHDLIEPIIAFDVGTISNALIVSDDEIYLCGLTADGSWLKKTNSKGEIISEWIFTKTVGRQPVIQCIAKTDSTLLVGLVDSYSQIAAVAILQGESIQYYYLPETMKVSLEGMRSDKSGLSIVSYSDVDSIRRIYYFHVSPEEAKGGFQVGKSTCDDTVIADSFAIAENDRVFLLRFSKIAGVVNNCNRELVVLDQEGQMLWQTLLPSDLVIRGISASENNVYMYGFQRCNLENHAYLICYGYDGELKWEKAFDYIEQIEYMVIDSGIIKFCGKSNRIQEQWILQSLDSEGEQCSFTREVFLPDSYKTFWLLNSSINIILNYEENPHLWQMDW